jgi:O-acetyl-ADP-ribose deacetylase
MIHHRMKVLVGDITKLAVEAVVNAANEAMCGGGGVDGAIHRAAGPELLQECLKVGGCPQGEARLTKGYRLPAKHIIHTVGPVWEGGGHGEAEALASAYRSSLELAEKVGATTVAFPCISTGVYGYPKPQACEVAVNTVFKWLSGHETPHEVTFCCFAEDDARLYRQRLGAS